MELYLMEHYLLCLAESFSQTGSRQPAGIDVCSVDMLRYRHRYRHSCKRFIIMILSYDHRAWKYWRSADNPVLFGLQVKIWELGLIKKVGSESSKTKASEPSVVMS